MFVYYKNESYALIIVAVPSSHFARFHIGICRMKRRELKILVVVFCLLVRGESMEHYLCQEQLVCQPFEIFIVFFSCKREA